MSSYVSVDVLIDDVLDEIDDDDLLAEIASRRLKGKPSKIGDGTTDIEIVREAYAELLCGRAAEARSILERLVYPRFQNVTECETEIKRLMRA